MTLYEVLKVIVEWREPVRCGECEFYNNKDSYTIKDDYNDKCILSSGLYFPTENDFCSRGKRRE